MRFFLSYARNDNRDLILKFYSDISLRIKRDLPMRIGDPGFIDKGLEAGSSWPNVLTRNLASCDVFIPLYSPSFFSSADCGKEVRIILDRLADLTPRPNAIVPVLWNPQRLQVHPCLATVNYDFPNSPPNYVSHGLERLMLLQDFSDQYNKFVLDFSQQVISACGGFPSAEPRNYLSVQSAFEPTEVVNSSPRTHDPSIVQFIFAVPLLDQIRELRQTSAAYGGDPRCWKPFLPPESDPIWLLAQKAATEERLFLEVLPFDRRLPERVREAEGYRKIVIVLVDSWSLLLPGHRDILREFDRQNYENCSVLIASNEADLELGQKIQDFDQHVKECFFFRSDYRDALYFQPRIRSKDEFMTYLRTTLATLRLRILNTPRTTGFCGPFPSY